MIFHCPLSGGHIRARVESIGLRAEADGVERWVCVTTGPPVGWVL